MEQLLEQNLITDFIREYHVMPENRFFDIFFETLCHKKYLSKWTEALDMRYYKKSLKRSQFRFYASSLFANDITKKR